MKDGMFTFVSEAARLARRWCESEAAVLRLSVGEAHRLGLYFDIEIAPANLATRSDYDVIVMPYRRPGPRTRVATMYV